MSRIQRLQWVEDGIYKAWPYLGIGFRLLERLLDLFVIWPSALLASLIAFYCVFTHASPATAFVEGFYATGDAMFRDSPAGNIRVTYCLKDRRSDKPAPDHPPSLPMAKSTECTMATEYQAVDVAMKRDLSMLSSIYLILFFVGAGYMLIVMGPRRFFCLPEEPNPERVFHAMVSSVRNGELK